MVNYCGCFRLPRLRRRNANNGNENPPNHPPLLEPLIIDLDSDSFMDSDTSSVVSEDVRELDDDQSLVTAVGEAHIPSEVESTNGDVPASDDDTEPTSHCGTCVLFIKARATPTKIFWCGVSVCHTNLFPVHRCIFEVAGWLRSRLTLGWIVENVFTISHNEDRASTELFYRDDWWYDAPEGERRNHSHGHAAEFRYHATTSFGRFAKMAGLVRYDVSSSRREDDELGERNFHTVKDMLQRAKKDRIPDKPLITFVDVIDYLTYNEMAFHCFNRDVLLYNVQPTAMTGTTQNSKYWFENPTTVCEQVNGGGSGLPYAHPCWYFGTDSVVMQEGGNWYDALGFINPLATLRRLLFPRYCIYEVCRRTHGPDGFRQVVYLRPTRVVWDFCGLLSSRFRFNDNALKRVTAVSPDGKWGTLLTMGAPVKGKPRMQRSVGRFGSRVSVETREEFWQTLLSRDLDQIGKAAPGICVADATGCLPANPADQAKAPMLAAGVKAIGRQWTPLLVALAQVCEPSSAPAPGIDNQSGGIARFEVQVDGLPDGKVKEVGREIGSPAVTTPACIPVESRKNDVVCVSERIENVANDTFSPELVPFIEEFIGLVVEPARRGMLYPLMPMEVDEHQTKPSQKQRNDRARNNTFYSNYVEGLQQIKADSFQKKEFYSGFKPPRNITNVRDEMNYETARFTIPFKTQVLKRTRWFGPGKSPVETQAQVARMLALKPGVDATDYSKFDGTISPQLKGIYFRMLLLAYGEKYSKAICDLWANDTNTRVTTVHGERYNSGSGQMSGSGTTSDSNTVVNAFIMFAAARLTGRPPALAYSHIGPAYGDDGLAHPSIRCGRAAKMAGLTMTMDFYPLGSAVPYLGRRWFMKNGQVQSFCEPLRTLEKLHVTVRSDEVPDRVARIDRALGYLVSDGHTPVVGDYCARVLALENYDPSEQISLTQETVWRMVNSKYHEPDNQTDLMPEFCEVLGVPVADCAAYIQAVKEATSLADFPPPLRTAKHAAPKWNVRVNDEVVPGANGKHPGRPKKKPTAKNKSN